MESSAGGTFTVAPALGPSEAGDDDHAAPEGGPQEYLEERRLKDLVKKHSEFIGYDIELQVERTTEKEVTDDEAEEEKAEEVKPEGGEDEPKVEEAEEPQEVKKKTKKVKDVSVEYEVLNKNKPLWTKDPKEVSTGGIRRLLQDHQQRLGGASLRQTL